MCFSEKAMGKTVLEFCYFSEIHIVEIFTEYVRNNVEFYMEEQLKNT